MSEGPSLYLRLACRVWDFRQKARGAVVPNGTQQLISARLRPIGP